MLQKGPLKTDDWPTLIKTVFILLLHSVHCTHKLHISHFKSLLCGLICTKIEFLNISGGGTILTL